MKNLWFLFLLLSSDGFAQSYDADSIHYTHIERPKQKKSEYVSSKFVEYFFNVQTGMLVGCNDCGKTKDYTFTAATVHGAAIGKKFRAGLGLGFDSYENWQTLPLFGMVSWDLIGNKARNALFVQMAYGWSHPWFVRDGYYSNYSSDPFSSVRGGRMLNPQIGYRISYYNLKISIAAGYKFQRIFYKAPGNYFYFPTCLTCVSQPLISDEVTQDMNRVQLTLSVGWK